MVKITEIPITGNMKEKFEDYLRKNPLSHLSLGDFGKWEGGGKCEVCEHSLIWSFRKFDGTDIGICCATNLIALQKCNGDYSQLNFERIVALEKKTIQKRMKEWEQKQKIIEMEVKYNNEHLFCKEVITLATNDKYFIDNEIVSDENLTYISDCDYKHNKPLKKIYQCTSWLNWFKDGVVNETYLEKLHEIMVNTPKEIIEEAKVLHSEYKIIIGKRDEKRELYNEYFKKARKLLEDVRLGMYDIDFVNSLYDFFRRTNFYTDKQMSAIDKLIHKYRKQIGDDEVEK